MLACWTLFEMLEDAGLPPGVIEVKLDALAAQVDDMRAESELDRVRFAYRAAVARKLSMEADLALAEAQEINMDDRVLDRIKLDVARNGAVTLHSDLDRPHVGQFWSVEGHSAGVFRQRRVIRGELVVLRA